MNRFGLSSPAALLTFIPGVLLALSFASTPTLAPVGPSGDGHFRLKAVTPADFAGVLGAEEPGWDFIPGVCTCPRTYGGQKAQSVVGGWRREAGGARREVVSIDIYEIESAAKAAEGMGRDGGG